jgi:8-oxo-dGTP diphosphatase
LLVNRSKTSEPFFGLLAFPGGYVHTDSDNNLFETAQRVIKEKTCLTGEIYIEQLQTISGKTRDPRGWSISQCYCGVVPAEQSNYIHSNCQWVEVNQIPLMDLAFDHNNIFRLASSRILNKTNYSLLPTHFLGSSFTLTELQKTYEIVLSTKLDKSSFRKKIEALGVITPTNLYKTGKQRPAMLYTISSQDDSFFRSNFV